MSELSEVFVGINVLGAKVKRSLCKDFISLAFHKGGRFFGLFRSYGRRTKSSVHITSSLLILTLSIQQNCLRVQQ